MRIIFLSILLIIVSLCKAQSTDPVAVVQRQLDNYNAQNLDGFANTFAVDAEVFINLGDSVAGIVGRDQIRERYGRMFRDNPGNKSTLIGRMVQGNFVFDHEWITGRENDLKIMAIYEVEEGLIKRCWFAR
jgi:putative hydrolase of HD superfamily